MLVLSGAAMSDKPDTIDLTSKDTFAHWTEVSIRYSDQDPMGHVNNVAIAQYVEAGRVMYIQRFLDLIAPTTLDFILARVVIDYKNEFMFPGRVEIGGRLTRIGNKSLTTGFGLFLGDMCVATSESVNVFFDMTTRTSVVPPDEVRAALETEL